MGGIAGILNSDGNCVEPALLEGMLQAIAHRGPEGAGVCYDGCAALGEVRSAACLPIAKTAPLPTDRGQSIAFDGAFYDDRELRDDLRRRGHVFTTAGDAELALRAFEEFGEDCVQHFNGEWALAIWDSRNRRLFASRDPLGFRPLYYTSVGRTFLFASEIKALCRHPQLARDFDVIALDQIFTLHAALPPRTILRGVYELPPGFSLFWSDGALQVFRHAQLDFRPDEAQDDALVQERLDELLTDAVRLRLRDCRHVATQASGSFDHLLTAALVVRCSESAPAPLELVFDDRAAVHRPLAREAVHPVDGPSLLRCSPADIGHVFPDVIRHAETPILETSPAAMFLWARFAREQGYRAVVSGVGADELFGGSDVYKVARLRRFCSRQPDSAGRRQLLERYLSESAATGARSTTSQETFFHTRPEDLAHPLFSHLPRWEQASRLKVYFSDDVRREIGDYDAREEMRLRLPARFKEWDPLCRAQYLEIAHHLPGCILSTQHDRMLAAHGLDGRHPFLDQRIVALAARLPARSKLRGLSEQELLRRIASRYLPADQVRPRRRSVRPPASRCFFGTPQAPVVCDYVEDLLNRDSVAAAGLFNPIAVERLVRKAQRGEATSLKDNLALTGLISTQLVVDQLCDSSLPLTRVARRELHTKGVD